MELAIIAAFGLITGSFLNVCIYRLPRGISVVKPRSRCPNCGHPIAAWENIPVASYILLRGRCSSCKAPISPRYPATELLVAAAFVLSFARYGASIEFLKFASLLVSLILLVFTDFDVKQLPDEVTLSGLFLGLVFALFVVLPGTDAATRFANLKWSAVGALVGGGILWLIGEGYMQLRGREGMGLGDVKMMAMVGSFLGWKLAFLTIFLSALAGSLAGVAVALWIVIKRSLRWRRKGKDWATARQRAQASAQAFFTRLGIPYGVFLGTMAVVSWMWGLQWWQWYVGHFTQ